MTVPPAPGSPGERPAFAAPHAPPPSGVLLGPGEGAPTQDGALSRASSRAGAPSRGRPLGRIALVLAIVAAVLAPAAGGFSAFRVARGAGTEFAARGAASFDWALLSPVRDLVLVGEIAFWVGTVTGLAAFVVGIVATARRRGRGSGVTAIVLSILGPAIFAGCVALALFAGAATSPDLGGIAV